MKYCKFITVPKSRRVAFIATLFFTVLLSSNPARALDIEFRVDSQSYAESFSAYNLYKNTPRNIDNGDIIYTNNRVYLGVAFESGFSIGGVARYDGILKHTPDAALIYFASRNDDFEPEERQYQYSLDANVLASQGIAASYQHQYKGLRLRWTGELLRAHRLTYGTLDGQLTLQNGELSANAELDYFYDRDDIFEREITDPVEGTGLSLSLQADFDSPYATHTLKLDDLVHRLYWQSIPHTTATANSDRIGDTVNGRLEINPLVSGREDNRDLTQRLPVRYTLDNYIHLPDTQHQLYLGLRYIASQFLSSIGYRWHLDHGPLTVFYSIQDQSLGLTHRFTRHLEYYLNLDDINIKDAHRLNAGFAIRW